MVWQHPDFVAYNGHEFSGAARISVNTEFVYDDAGRTVIYHKNTITIVDVIASDDQFTMTALASSAREKLSKPGGHLSLRGIGLGAGFISGSGSSSSDVKWGPQPKILRWTPLGAGNAIEIEWQCEYCMAICGGPVDHPAGQVLALNYSINYSLDQHGDTTRTITGYLQIAQTRVGNRVLYTADQHRDKIAPQAPEGFLRVSRDFSLSADKCRLDFSIVDRQIPSDNPWPDGVTEITCRQRTRWDRKSGTRYISSLEMSVRGARGIPKNRLWAHFTTLLRQRILAGRAELRYALIGTLTVEEEIFGRGCAFMATWQYTSSIKNFIQDSGLFRQIGTSWDKWRTSLEEVQFNQRGTAGLRHISTSDAIVDICNDSNQFLSDWENLDYQGNNRPSIEDGAIQEAPPAEYSWLKYEMSTTVHRDRPVARLSYMQEPDAEPTTPSMRQSAAPDWGAPGGEDDELQQSGRSKYFIVLQGEAQRAGHKIPRPKLEQVGDQTPVEVKSTFTQRVVANALGVPIYAAAWSIVYALPNSPGTVHPEDNLKEGINGTSGTITQSG